MNSIFSYLNETASIATGLHRSAYSIERLIKAIHRLRRLNRRLFILGLGGSAANASHAVNDFRKLCNIEAYTPTDNVSEFSARANDDGLPHTLDAWLKTSNLTSGDGLLVLSVGGGNRIHYVSTALIAAIEYARVVNASVWSIVGREEGFAQSNSDICIEIPEVNRETLTPHAEEFQSVLLHLIVSHPLLKQNPTKW